MPDALRTFADDMDDAGADLIIAALILNSRLRGPGLRDVLGGAGHVGRARSSTCAARSTASAGRPAAACRSWWGCPSASCWGWPCSTAVTSRPTTARSGQVVLLVVVGLFAAGFYWLRKLASLQDPGALSGSGPASRGPRAAAGGPVDDLTGIWPARSSGSGCSCSSGPDPGQAGPDGRRRPHRRAAPAQRRWPRRREQAPPKGLAELREDLGASMNEFYLRQGWQIRSLRADLAILDRSVEQFLATKLLLAAVGIIFGPFVFAAVYILGLHLTPTIPVWLAPAVRRGVLPAARPGGEGPGGRQAAATSAACSAPTWTWSR